MKKYLIAVLMVLSIISGCSSMSVVEKESKRSQLDEMAATAITGLIEKDSTLQQKIDDSLGYAVANMKVTKVPIFGAGGGEGVFVNKKSGKRLYFTVSRFDIGGGWGARSYKILLIFDTEEMLERLGNGTWEFQAGVEASAGTAAVEGSSGAMNEGYTVHVLSDGGASATATARVIKISVDDDLTDNQ